tara:strand:+ start:8278 stop:8571 length:294 start_codon:yes stop_codon:yes gene_type:complete
MKKINICFLVLSISLISKAQQADSLQQKTVQIIKEKFPSTRILDFEYGQSSSRDFDSELFDQNFQEGEIKAQHIFKAKTNIPIYKTRKWALTGSLNY